MPTVGEKLREARLAADLELSDISEETKIRPHYLQCLEDDDYDGLPTPFCTVAFLRHYAAAVGLDSEDLVAEIRRELPGDEASIPEFYREPATPRGPLLAKASRTLSSFARRSAGGIGKVVIALALIAGGSYWWFQSAENGNETETPGTTAPVPASTESGSAVQPTQSEPSQPEPEAVADAPSSPSDISGPASNLMAIEIRATDQVWIRSLADGVTERERIMNAGEVLRIQADALVNLTFGNAGAVSLVIDGTVQEGVGNPGEVKHLRITRNGWEFISSGSF